MTLEFFSGGAKLGECRVDVMRADLKRPSLHPTGECGFSFLVPGEISEQGGEDITIKVKNNGTVLCVLDKARADRVAGSPAHPFSRLRRRLAPENRHFDPVVFMHIPKTAGTTFNTFAKRVYPFSRAITHIEFYDAAEYAKIAREYLFISGHLNVGQIRTHFTGRPFTYCTLVREPYAQLQSHLNWLRGIGADKESAFYQSHHRLFKSIADDISEKQQLAYEDLEHIVNNLDGVLKKLLDNNQTRYFLSEECEAVTSALLEEALENMKMFELIGTTEDYEAFKASFCERQRLEMIESNRSLNRAHHAALFDVRDPRNREILLPLVDKDLVLYERVQGGQTL